MRRRGLQQLVGVEREIVATHAGRGRDGGRNDLSLSLETLDAGVDQTLAELINVEKQHQKGHQPAEVEDDDPSGQRR